MNLDEIKKKVINWANNKEYISRVWLFGSRTTGQHTPESDIDIAFEINEAVLPPNDSARGVWHYDKDDLVNELQQSIPHKVHLVLYSPKDNEPLTRYVNEDGILIYEKAARTGQRCSRWLRDEND